MPPKPRKPAIGGWFTMDPAKPRSRSGASQNGLETSRVLGRTITSLEFPSAEGRAFVTIGHRMQQLASALATPFDSSRRRRRREGGGGGEEEMGPEPTSGR